MFLCFLLHIYDHTFLSVQETPYLTPLTLVQTQTGNSHQSDSSQELIARVTFINMKNFQTSFQFQCKELKNMQLQQKQNKRVESIFYKQSKKNDVRDMKRIQRGNRTIK